MSDRFTQQRVDQINMKTAQRHRIEAGVGEHTFVASGERELQVSSQPDNPPMSTPLATDLVVGVSTDIEKLNKTECAYYNYLRSLNYPYLGVQNITLKLADDCRYTSDFNYLDPNGRLIFAEVKGFFRDDAKVKIKVAARMYRLFDFKLIRKSKSGWETEDVKP